MGVGGVIDDDALAIDAELDAFDNERPRPWSVLKLSNVRTSMKLASSLCAVKPELISTFLNSAHRA
jgi:hypothetical protein